MEPLLWYIGEDLLTGAGVIALEPSPECVARVRDVCKRFGTQTVLDGVHLDVHRGEVLGLMGPNGGGKSTLLMALAGLLTPDEGQIEVCGVPAPRLAVEQTGTVGLLMSDPGLYPLLTGRENLHFFGGLYGLRPAETDARVAPLLDELGMGDSLERPATSYSSGMKQKVSLARALLLNPKLLLLDEPTSNLDPISAFAIYQTVRNRADEGLSVVLTTHDLGSIEAFADRAVLFRQCVRREVAVERRPEIQSPLLAVWREEGEVGT